MTEMESPSSKKLISFLNDIDDFDNSELYPELFETDPLDKLLTLQAFASRIKHPSEKLLKTLKSVKNKILKGDESENNEVYFRQHLQRIEKKNSHRFRTKTNEDFA